MTVDALVAQQRLSQGEASRASASARSCGALGRQAAMKTQHSGEKKRGESAGGGASSTVWIISTHVCGLAYGYTPVAASMSTSPRLQMSDEYEYGCRWMRSGDM